MAVAGRNVKAQQVARIDGRYWIMRVEDRPGSILSSPELAHDALLSGQNAWIAAMDSAKLSALLGKPIRSIATRGSDAAGVGGDSGTD